MPTYVVCTEDDERVIGMRSIDYQDVSCVMVNETLGGVRAAGPRRETSHTIRHNKVPEDR